LSIEVLPGLECSAVLLLSRGSGFRNFSRHRTGRQWAPSQVGGRQTEVFLSSSVESWQGFLSERELGFVPPPPEVVFPVGLTSCYPACLSMSGISSLPSGLLAPPSSSCSVHQQSSREPCCLSGDRLAGPGCLSACCSSFLPQQDCISDVPRQSIFICARLPFSPPAVAASWLAVVAACPTCQASLCSASCM